MTIGTTSLSYGIATQYFDYIVPAFRRNLVWDQLLSLTQFAKTTYQGKGSAVNVVIDDDYQESVTAITQITDGGRTDTSYVPTVVTMTPTEYGKLSWTLTGKGNLQFFDDANSKVMGQVSNAAVKSYDTIIAAAALEGGTATDDSVIGGSTRFRVINPDAAHKPGGALTTDHVTKAMIDLQDRDVPTFDNGMYVAVIHPAMKYDLMNEVAASGMPWTEYSKFRQAGISEIGEFARGIIGTWAGFVWVESNSPSMKIASGGSGGGYSYKTLFCGKNYLAAAFVPVGNLPWNGEGERYPIHPYIELRVKGDSSDNLCRNKKFGYYMIGACGVAKKNAGFFYVSKSAFASLPN